MYDELTMRALLVGVILAIAAGPVGSFILWKRIAYFGDALAHSSLLGVALSMLLSIDIILGVFIVCVLISFVLSSFKTRRLVSSDTLLGMISHSALALGLISLSLLGHGDHDHEHILFGEIYKLSWNDVWTTGIIASAILGILIWQWRSLVSHTINEEVAYAEKISSRYSEFLLLIISGALVAIAIKIVGALLIGALLIIPAAAARLFSRSPEQMAVLASILGIVSVLLGLNSAILIELPPGPSIAVSCLLIYLFGLAYLNIRHKFTAKVA